MMKTSVAAALLVLAGSVECASLSETCCSALARLPELQGKVYLPSTSQYEARLQTYYSANAAQEPWCMVLPQSTSDVSSIAKVFYKNGCTFGIRSAAHSAWKGSNGVKDGVTVDFSHMNTTTYDQPAKVAKIQPGSNWGRVYETLDPFGVVAVGGRASVVGVGGFTTGGGYSFHSSSRGFACDNVVNFEVVLADGRIVNANSKTNADLYKALKGGSGNFGFVTRVDQRVVENNQLWGGFVFFDLAKRDAVFQAYLDFASNMDKDLASQALVSFQYAARARVLLAVVSNVEAVADAPAFNGFRAVGNTSNTITIGPFSELVPQFTGPTPLGLYANWMTGTAKQDIRLMKFIEDKHVEYTTKMQAAAPDADISVLVQFQPFTQSIVSHAAKAGGNSLGLEDKVKNGPLLNWLIAVTVDTEEAQTKINPLTIEYRNAVNAYATQLGINQNWEFLNYALGDQQPILHYGARSVQALQAASRKYDPYGVFQKKRLSGFKLPK
ncbi:FAD-dependent monooxygenase CTB5 [Paramyrothecium foliicola]|nr:FAD-dependent monooxygenase CTB5 [Paramyrothecium foliicola]